MIKSFKLLSIGSLASFLVYMVNADQPPYPYQYVEPYIQTFSTISAYSNGFYFPLDPITDRRPSRSHHSRSHSRSCSKSHHSRSKSCSCSHSRSRSCSKSSERSKSCSSVRPISTRRSRSCDITTRRRSFFNGHHVSRHRSSTWSGEKPCGCPKPCPHPGNGFSCSRSKKSRSCSFIEPSRSRRSRSSCSEEWTSEAICHTSIDYRRLNGYRSDWSCDEDISSLCPIHSTTECPCPCPCPCPSNSSITECPCSSSTTSKSVLPTSETTSRSVAPTSQSVVPTSGKFCPPVTVTVTHVPSAVTRIIICEPVIPNCPAGPDDRPMPEVLEILSRAASTVYTTSPATTTSTSSSSYSTKTTVSGQQANAAIPIGSNALGNSLMALFFTIALVAFLA